MPYKAIVHIRLSKVKFFKRFCYKFQYFYNKIQILRRYCLTKSLVDNYSEDELRSIVNSSICLAEVVSKLGYKTKNGNNHKTVKKRLEKYNISTSHFESSSPHKRSFEEVFCINSTVSQATLRKWYKRIFDDCECAICGQSKIWNEKELTMILDHIDGDNHNNEINNLRWICPNCDSQLPTFAGRNNKGRHNYLPVQKRKQYKKICPLCNINEISKNSKMCWDCRCKERRKNIPPKEELEKLIYTTSFVKIGKKYNVSDNSVRKWCKGYGLPFRYGELHKYGA